MKKILPAILFLSAILPLQAQAQESLMRSSGKIYVVVTVIAIIFVLIVAYLLRLDKKVSQLENKDK